MKPWRSRLDAVLQAAVAVPWAALWFGVYLAALLLIETLLFKAVPWLRQQTWLFLVGPIMIAQPLRRRAIYLLPALPLWRDTLTVDDRRTLVWAAMGGALLGFMMGVLGSFVLLDPNLGSPRQSTSATAGIIFSIVGASFLASLGMALRVPARAATDPQ